mmetsp:Transcript_45655/g.138724  ORF Transcript_45655/g.138724 Transcript_45655/m.138724 type:complete len:498 (-) Transcript_45655:40-1533(-)
MDSRHQRKRRKRIGPSIPTLLPGRGDPSTSLIPHDEFRALYRLYQAVHLPGFLSRERRVAEGCGAGSDAADGVAPKSDEGSSEAGARKLTCEDLHSLFESLCDSDKESWTVENAASLGDAVECSDDNPTSPNAGSPRFEDGERRGDFLRLDYDGSVDEGRSGRRRRGYCSFLVQHDADAMKRMLDGVPLAELPISAAASDDDSKDTIGDAESSKSQAEKSEKLEGERIMSPPFPKKMKMNHGPCLWVFFGRNDKTNYNSREPPQKALEGRPEHTDSVSHDGTWHYQLSGTKVWKLRPTQELLEQMEKNGLDEDELRSWSVGSAQKVDGGNEDDRDGLREEKTPVRVEVTCREGDVLLVNTRLWWHATTIPPQDAPSVSYARDVYLKDAPTASAQVAKDDAMTNIDGLYAANDVASGTILFTEDTMPDCEMHRSKVDPNCEVVELEDGDGKMAVVSMRDIKAGEFFCVAESSDEDDENDGEDFEETGDVLDEVEGESD